MNESYIENQNWSRLFVIFQQFGYDLSKYKEEKKTAQYLWFELINIQKKWMEDLEELIRFNTNLCFKLDKKDSIKTVNSPLYRMHNLFDKDYFCPDEDPLPGFKKFLESVKDIFGNLKKFKKDVKIVQSIKIFFKKRHDKLLIEYYEYIKRISLPVRGFESLRMALFTVLKKFDHLSTLISIPTVFSSFITELKEIKRKYIYIYIEEHNKFQKEMKEFKNKLHNLEEYRVLKLLSEIEVIKSSYSIKPIKKYIDDFFPKYCNEKNIKNILHHNVKCNCNFVLNENLVIPSINKIKPLLKKGINDYISQLRNKKYFRKRLKKYLKNNKNSNISKIIFGKVKHFKELYSYINKNLIDEINTALCDTYSIDINGEYLIKKISGSYYAADLEELSNNLESEIIKIIDNELLNISKDKKEKIIINIVNR